MTKEFEINDILSAVNSFSKIEKKKSKTTEKKDSTDKNDIIIYISNRLHQRDKYEIYSEPKLE